MRLNEAKTFAATLAPLAEPNGCYGKRSGREQLLAYLARYTHRVAITNTRLLNVDETHVSFRWKDQRQRGGHKNKVMRITIAEFMRRFLLHVLPDGFHRIRHYGLLANGHRADQLALCRSLLAVRSAPADCNNNSDNDPGSTDHEAPPCPCCGGRMAIIEIFEGSLYRPYPVRKLDSL